MRHVIYPAGLLVGAAMVSSAAGQVKDYAVKSPPLSAVRVTDGFWGPRLETNRTVSLWHVLRQAEQVGEFNNFAKAGGSMQGPFQGSSPARDSDAYKCIEGVAYTLMAHPEDEKLRAYAEALIGHIAAAQEADGYLYTARKITPPAQMPAMAGPTRWNNERQSHETYVMGLLCESGVAYFEATGKRTLLDVGIRSANLIDQVFGPGAEQRHETSGHEEIELAMARLYRATGDEKYLKLAKYFVDQRGRHTPSWGTYAQDAKPVAEESQAVGHAVRAGYLYCGVTDLAAMTGEGQYAEAMDRIWKNAVERRMYVTGGWGARGSGEAFGNDYELPNMTAYNETCAAVSSVFWQQRMFQLHRDAKYVDVLERTLYNQVLAGVSQGGDRFFYTNVLESDRARNRSTRMPWFTWPCCLTNVVRILPAMPGYIYAMDGEGVYVNLFVAGDADLKVGGKNVRIAQETNYPWDGRVKMTVTPEVAGGFTLRVRIPGWAQGRPVPGDLYRYAEKEVPAWGLRVNGEKMAPALEKGYAVLKRAWKAGDTVELDLLMPVHRVLANEAVEADRGRVALERGPLVYCAEGLDNGGRARNLVLPPNAELKAEERKDLLGGVMVIRGTGQLVMRNGEEMMSVQAELMAVPYCLWANRGEGEMAVWLASEAGQVPASGPARGR